VFFTLFRRENETRLMFADLRRWWSRPDRLTSLRVVYLVPLVLFALDFITFQMVSIWINLVFFALLMPTWFYARRTWRRERR
jgi:positive regulator of sigma E activity